MSMEQVEVVTNVNNCPMDVESLAKLSDAVLYRIAVQLEVFPAQTFERGLSISDQEALFIEMPKNERVEFLSVHLIFRNGPLL